MPHTQLPLLPLLRSPLLLAIDWPGLAGFANSLITIGLGALATWAGARYWKNYDARQLAAKETAKDKAQWREGRLLAETALREGLNTERADRLKEKMTMDAHLARVTEVLNRLVDVADSLTTMTERVSWHGKELENMQKQFQTVHEELREMRQDIKNIDRGHA